MTRISKNIGIVLVLYKQKHNLDDLYCSLSKQTNMDYRIYFVDNNADRSDEKYSGKINDNFQLDIVYVYTESNLGFAGGNNLGALKALEDGCEYLFFLNNDTFLSENCLSNLKIAVDSNLQYGAAAPMILSGLPDNNIAEIIQEFGAKADFKTYDIQKNFEKRKLKDVKASLKDIFEVDLVSGGAAFFKASAFLRCGLWEEKYFAYGDEIDLFKRLNDAGFKSIAVKNAVLWHNHNWSPANKQGYYFEYYLIQRNKYLYFRKFKLYGRLFVSFIIDMIKFPWRLVWFVKVCDLSLGLYYLRGTFAGMIGKAGKPNLSFLK